MSYFGSEYRRIDKHYQRPSLGVLRHSLNVRLAPKAESILIKSTTYPTHTALLTNSLLTHSAQCYKGSVLAEWTGNRVGLLSARQ